MEHRNKKGMTALYWASYRGHSTIVEQLIDDGARQDILANYGDTPMMKAALYGNTDCVGILLRAGGDMEIQHTPTGHTALSMENIVEMLVKGGARMDTYNNKGHCPLHKAAQRWSGFW